MAHVPSIVNAFSLMISKCVHDVISWAGSNELQLNPDKTEALWCRRQHQLPSAALLFAGIPVALVKSVHNLGICIDTDLSM